jgi:hypothetical protein
MEPLADSLANITLMKGAAVGEGQNPILYAFSNPMCNLTAESRLRIPLSLVSDDTQAVGAH